VIAIQTEQLLSTAAAAKLIGVSTRRILQLVDAKVLPAAKVTDGWHDQHVFTIENVEALKERRAGRR
jgi:hypothetical protein